MRILKSTAARSFFVGSLVALISGAAVAEFEDCNGNGIPDADDITSGISEDCNSNGVPDECDVDTSYRFTSDTLTPIGAGTPHSIILSDLPSAAGDVLIEVAASADLASPEYEYITIAINGTAVGDLFTASGQDCASPPDEDTATVPKDLFNQLLAGGAGSAVIDIVASEDVNEDLCVPSSYAVVVLTYPTGLDPNSPDCNFNGIPDECDLDGGTSEDCNLNDVPDECEVVHPIHAVSGPLSPFDYQYPQSFALNPAPPALTEVTFSFTALADLASSAELVTLAINGSVIGDAFVSGVDCAEIQDSLIVSPAIYNSAIGDSGIGVISLTATAEVGSCTGSFIAVTVDYVGGAGPDCNFNGVPDECDLSTGTSQDCNDNNIPDECETDCNDNGIPDDCDLSQQTSPDCDGNGVPDECEGARQISETSPPLSPIDDQHPQSFTLDPAPPALEGVSLSFTALADLSSSSEYMFVELNGTEIGTIYSGYGDDCMVLEDSLIISALAYNSAVESTGMAVITVTPSSSVDPGTCADSFITIAIDYVGGTGNDCNVNGVPDECDLDSGFSEDCNLNGAPDECEIGGPIDAYQFLADLTAAADSISALVLDRYNFSGGESGTYISDGGGDMYDYGNELNTDLAFLIPYTGSTVVDSDLQFGPGSRYFTAKSTGLFVMAAIDISIGSFSITGNLGSGFEFADGFQISTTVNFRPYTIFVKRVYRTGCCNPSVNHVIIVPGDSDGLTQSFSANTNLDDHSIDGLADRDAIFFLLVARRDPSTSIGPPLEQPDALAMANAFLSLLPAGNDCNQNEIPDDCDILQATSEDCNENGVPDECERDCNGNGTPDACDLAAGTAEDCNADGIPDECNLTSGEFRVDSGQLSPLGDGFAQTLFIEQPPPAASTVRLAFQAVGDLSSSSAYVTVDLNGTVIGDVFVSTGSNCPPQPDVDQIYITPEVYNGTFAPGAPLEVMMTPSDAVDVFCDDPTFVQVTVDYQATSLDVDGNGILDACEACPADLDGDETVGVSDFLLVLAQWGPCPPVCIADVDGNGAVDVADFLAVLAHWGACP